MMKLPEPHQTNLDRLLTWKKLPIASLYMPVITRGPDKRENLVRFKGLVKQVGVMLKDEGWSEEKVRAFTQPLLDAFGSQFWEQAGQPGFACFYEGRDHEPVYWFLADEVESLVTLHRRVHLKPLLQAWSADRPYFLLCLDHETLSLYQGNAFSLEEMEDEAIQKTVREALGTEREIKSIQFHTQTQHSASGERAAMFHGQGGPGNVKDDQMKRFFRQVTSAITARLEKQGFPLVLCGLPEVLAVYRKVNRYDQTLEKGIEQHPESLTEDEVRRRVVAIIKEYSSGTSDGAMGTYKQRIKELRVADSVDTVLPLAATGRVEQLFVAGDHESWGHFNPEHLRIEHAASNGYNREDLLDTAARMVVQFGGEVHFVTDKELADQLGVRHIAAILRPSG